MKDYFIGLIEDYFMNGLIIKSILIDITWRGWLLRVKGNKGNESDKDVSDNSYNGIV
jgi:hypothetical protein